MTLSSVLSFGQKEKNVKPIRADVLEMLEKRDYTLEATSLSQGYSEFFVKHDYYLQIRGGAAKAFLPYYTNNPEMPLDGGPGRGGLNFTAIIEDYTAKYDRKGVLIINFIGKLMDEAGDYCIRVFPDGSSVFSIFFNRYPTIEYTGKVKTKKADDLAYAKQNMSKKDIEKENKKLAKEKSKFPDFDPLKLDAILSNMYKVEIDNVEFFNGDGETRDLTDGYYMDFKGNDCECVFPVAKGEETIKGNPFPITPVKLERELDENKNMKITFEHRANSSVFSFTEIITPKNEVTIILKSVLGKETIFKGRIVEKVE